MTRAHSRNVDRIPMSQHSHKTRYNKIEGQLLNTYKVHFYNYSYASKDDITTLYGVLWGLCLTLYKKYLCKRIYFYSNKK
jgi:hypothetical protein